MPLHLSLALWSSTTVRQLPPACLQMAREPPAKTLVALEAAPAEWDEMHRG